jgi:predicted MFS family arabinose efflux permease
MKRFTGEFAAGWRVLVAAVIGNAFSAGTLAIHTMGILGPALGSEYHWKAGAVTSGFLILSLSTLIAAPLAGMLADRFGVRKVALASTLMLAPTYMSFALLPPSLPIYYALWLGVAFLGCGTISVTWARALNNRFQVNKGLALGIALVGTGLSGSLLKPFEFWLVDLGGWRIGYIGLGSLSLVSFAVAFFLLHDVAPPAPATRAARDASTMHATGILLGDAVKRKRLWLLLAAVALAALGTGGAVPNMESILKSKGFAQADIRSLVPITGMAIVIGRLGSSYLIDRIWAPIVAFVMLACATIAFLVLTFLPPSVLEAAAIVLTIGLAVGMEADIAPFLVARYFGPINFGSIYGVIYGAFAVGTGLGAMSYGVAFDRFGDYRAALISSAVILAVSGVMLMSLGTYAFPHVSRRRAIAVARREAQSVGGGRG